jgi:hypothetical protein
MLAELIEIDGASVRDAKGAVGGALGFSCLPSMLTD